MYRCGPMTRYWCMRYEAKHNYFKDLAQKMKCFKNICKSLAERHQHLICYQYLTSNVLLKDTEVGKSENHFTLHVYLRLYYSVHCSITDGSG